MPTIGPMNKHLSLLSVTLFGALVRQLLASSGDLPLCSDQTGDIHQARRFLLFFSGHQGSSALLDSLSRLPEGLPHTPVTASTATPAGNSPC